MRGQYTAVLKHAKLGPPQGRGQRSSVAPTALLPSRTKPTLSRALSFAFGHGLIEIAHLQVEGTTNPVGFVLCWLSSHPSQARDPYHSIAQ